MGRMYEAPIANGTISPYLVTLVYRYVSAIVPLTSLLVLHAYGPMALTLFYKCAPSLD